MLKWLVERRNYIIFIVVIILFFLVIFTNKKVNAKVKSFYYFDEVITVEIFEGGNVFDDVDKIFKKYYQYYNDPSLAPKSLIDYGKDIYVKSHGYLDITEDKLIDAVKNGKSYDFKSKMNDLDDLNFNLILGYYATGEVIDYLHKNNIEKFLINEDGNVYVGDHYNDGKYNVSIQDINGNLINIVKLENEYLAIRGNSKTFKNYMVNPITSSKEENNKLVVVIGKDIRVTNMVANTLYLMSVDDGLKFVKNFDVAALWVDKNRTVYGGFDDYVLQ